MLKIIMIMIVGLTSVLMMSCSSKIATISFSESMVSAIVDNLDGTFTDKRTLLQWTKNDFTPGPGSCYGGTGKNLMYSELHLECLNRQKYLGYNDWRMPTYEELESLIATPEIKNGSILNPQVHERLRNHAYWSTTDLSLFIYKRGIMIYNVIGPIYMYHIPSAYYVWPVRSDNKVKLIASSY
jgi:hypothetical protein